MIQEMIDKALSREQESRKGRKRSGKWSPSSFGKCYRAQIYNRLNMSITNPPDSRILRVFKVGKMFHDFVEYYIPHREKEVVCEKDDIFGYADIVTQDSVIDLKSQHSKAFWYMKKETYNIAEEKKTNWLQVACYAWILKKKYCKLVFISRDDLSIMPYTMPTEKWLKPLGEELTKLRIYWGDKELPKGEARAYNGKECQYCGWRTLCKKTKS